ncbi:MAG: 3-methyl-2-oxobutanoate hydroxymethyltransferase [Firmicutes bacterium]|nr:3-methyl-2-oxobutanoate hydroxymethyltransferase [Bacillota bacterium]
MSTRKPTIRDIRSMKQKHEKIAMVTAYDYPSAMACARANADMLLVGDSLGMVVLGYDSTLPVTMADMIHHTSAVRRGAPGSFVVTDMPFMSYQASVSDALHNAGRLMKEAACDAVKLEGGQAIVAQVAAMIAAGIPVMGHIGLQPQSVHQLGGYRLQGKTAGQAHSLYDDARRLEDAGCFAIVLECVAENVAQLIAESLSIPVIGIGSGPYVDGQVLVFHDLLGINGAYVPSFAKSYKHLLDEMANGVTAYRDEVRTGSFPPAGQVASVDPAVMAALRKEYNLGGHH